ncbi:MAG TPA: PxKF domain-containing protein [Microlunatus sp.]|nr:PxKF domain-containing protein [Microlunatus sp.]
MNRPCCRRYAECPSPASRSSSPGSREEFQLHRANGALVQSATMPVWLTPVNGSATSLPVKETVSAATADVGSTYRCDSLEKTYVDNWKAPSTSGNSYRLGVKLDDVQSDYVTIGVRLLPHV